MYGVDEHSPPPNLPGLDALDGQNHLGLVVEVREPLVVVERLFVRLRDRPDRNGNRAALLRLDGEVGARHAPFEQQAVVLDLRCADDPGSRAAHPYLPHIQIAAVSDVVSFCHTYACIATPQASVNCRSSLPLTVT